MGTGPVRRRSLRFIAIALVVLAGLFGARAYFEWEPARIVIERDTLVLYGGSPTRVPYQVVTRRGEDVAWAKPALTGAESFLSVTRLFLACRDAGSGDVTVRVDELSARFHVICRRGSTIHGTGDVDLALGDAPRRVELKARLASGADEVVRPVELRAGDTLVARFVDGHIVPVGAGRTSFRMDLGGLRTAFQVTVTEAIARDTLELRPGEFRSWPLAAGRYDITVRSLVGARSFAELEMTAEGTKCVPSRLDKDTIHCLVTDTAALALYNRHPASTPRSPPTAVSIIRTQ